jgi:hypothetical protein
MKKKVGGAGTETRPYPLNVLENFIGCVGATLRGCP